ncbi:hypothetical protein CRYUN_Cryun04dG0164600 [Craigia yunnanensis]
MECNKDEATRAKELAEKKFIAKDITGAKKFALKAQNLYHGLEGIPQMIATLDVHISTVNKINGEADWYGILGVNPQADDEAMRKQYRKVALMLHPDKNKSRGADGAFKLISKAWSLLPDKAKRVAYDQKRSGKVIKKVSTPTGASTASKTVNGFYNATKTSVSSVKTSKSNPGAAQSSNPAARSSNPASSHKPKPNTFWTYEYLRVYLNHNLLCPNCHEPFLAVETAPPTTSNPSPLNFSQQRQNSNSQAGGSSTAAQAVSVVQHAYVKVRREQEEAQAATKREEAMRRKHHASKRASGASSTRYTNAAKRMRGMEDGNASTHGTNITNQMGVGNGGTTNLSGSKLGSLETASKDVIGNENANEKQDKSLVNNEVQDQNKSGGFVDQIKGDHCVKSFPGTSGVNIDVKTLEAMSINVPDPDFHDFDKDRTERSFEDYQVWAAYDDDDGMPRYYAMIHNVISWNPFKMQISWLNSKTNSELGSLNWVGSGFSKTCGEFRIGWHEINSSLNSFSHKVRWTKGMRGTIRIYPRRGDVWAIYRNWSPYWNELTADEVIHKYDMVEYLTSQEALNAPKGCRELDPAATPVELLQTTSRRLSVRKVEKFEKNISKRGAVPETTTKKGKDYPVGPVLLGFFIFVVIGSSLFQIIRTATSGGMA